MMNAKSILTVVTPAQTRDLTTLATIKDELGVKDRAFDDRLRRWIREASGYIETYCNRVFAQEQVSELWRWAPGWHNAPGHARRGDPLCLRRYPVVSIDSLAEDDGDPLTTDDYELDAEHGFLWRMWGQVSGQGGSRYRWCAMKVVVTYTAGYALLGEAPYPLEQACQALIKHRWAARDRDPMLRSQVVPGVLEQQWWVAGAGQSGMPPELVDLLEPFREDNV
jgi:gp6-like head-tail connector protein